MDYGIALQALISLVGELTAQGQEAKARELLQQSMDNMGKLDLPKFKEVVAQQLGPSALEKVMTDPKLRDAQLGALGSYDEIIDGGGMATADTAAINGIGNQLARRLQATRSSVQQGFDSRGMGESGAAIAAQQLAGQDETHQLNQAGLDQSAEAMRRRFQAIAAKGDLAGNIRGQDYAEKSRAAQAADEIARFNAGARANAAGANNALAGQTFDANYRKVAGQAGAAGALAGNYDQAADSTRNMFGYAGRAAGTAISPRPAEKSNPTDKLVTGWKDPDKWEQYPYGGW